MIYPNYLSRMGEFNVEYVFGSKFKIDGRITYITQRLRTLNMPISHIVYVS